MEKFLNKIGIDKFLHFLVLALLTSWASFISTNCMWIMLILSPFIGLVKELLDNKIEWKDIIAGIVGSIASVVVYWIIQLL